MLFFSDSVYRTLTEAGKHESCEQSSKSVLAHSIICFNAALNYCFPLPLLSNLAYFQPTLYHTVSSSKNSSFFTSELLQQAVDVRSLFYRSHITNSASNICSTFYSDWIHILLPMCVFTLPSAVSHVRLQQRVFSKDRAVDPPLILDPSA